MYLLASRRPGRDIKKIAVFFAVFIAIVLVVLVALYAWRMLEINDWIDRCADETSGSYIADQKARETHCARTVDAISRNPQR